MVVDARDAGDAAFAGVALGALFMAVLLVSSEELTDKTNKAIAEFRDSPLVVRAERFVFPVHFGAKQVGEQVKSPSRACPDLIDEILDDFASRSSAAHDLTDDVLKLRAT